MHSDWPPKRAKQTLPEEELQRRDKAKGQENTYESVFDNDLAGENLTNDTPAADLP